MAQCKWCSKRGLFLTIDQHRLCKTCSFIIGNEASETERIAQASKEIIEKSNNVETIASRTNVIIEKLSTCLKYEEKGLEMFNIPVSQLVVEFADEGNQKILNILTTNFNTTLEKVEKLNSEKAKQNAIDKFVSKSINFKEYFNNKGNSYNENLITIEEMSELLHNVMASTEKEKPLEDIKLRKFVMSMQILNYQKSGVVTGVQTCEGHDSCDTCKALSKKRFTIPEALKELPLPNSECDHKMGCRCTYVALTDSS